MKISNLFLIVLLFLPSCEKDSRCPSSVQLGEELKVNRGNDVIIEVRGRSEENDILISGNNEDIVRIVKNRRNQEIIEVQILLVGPDGEAHSYFLTPEKTIEKMTND